MTHGLNAPLTLPCGAVIPNRVVKAAMTEGLADADDGPSSALETLYRRWSGGGAGLLITGNVMVDRRFLERGGNVVIDADCNPAALASWASAGTEGGNQLWMQINHPGRQCTRITSARPMGPSPVKLSMAGMFARPRAMTADDIQDVIERFALVASRAREAGFTGVQVHGAHGYLLSQFLSPVTNRRDDGWGGDLAGRARLLLEVVRAVRTAVGAEFPVSVKLNSADFQKGGFSLQDCVEVAGRLGEEGIDLLEISGGTYETPAFLKAVDTDSGVRASTRRREAYFLRYAAAIRQATTVPLMVTGGFRSVAAMGQALAEDGLAAVGIARPFCLLPDLAARLLDGSLTEAPSPEFGLRLGPGPLGPRTRSPTLRALNTQADAAWFYRQIVRLSRGEAADPGLSPARALVQHLAGEWRLARRRHYRASRAG